MLYLLTTFDLHEKMAARKLLQTKRRVLGNECVCINIVIYTWHSGVSILYAPHTAVI